ncbi:ATPase/histidine kinase/DNA gyrase B/HSP90 domain protein [Clostridiales bacterium oral taxon 876 str. F0540]|nr:ATPase/histidine kinase/DNA gyrase B/HSP90 domain protein [Clostridiales bacterium oral taxon 876 str. F0540]
MYKNLETLEWNLNNKVEFINIISHELRTPLNIILGAQKLLTLNINEEGNKLENKINFIKYLASIQSNSYRLQRIINNFIDITDFELGMSKLNLSNDDIVKVVKNIVKHASFVANRKGINILLATNVKQKIMAFDKEKIERIILNLLSNAIKFSENNKEIDIILLDKKEKIQLLVIDQGIGIPRDKLSNLFDSFVQVDKSLTRNHEGSGTGLSVVKSFVKLHNGSVSVKSKENAGTSFMIELPSNIVPGSRASYLSDEDINIIQKIQIEFSDICEISYEYNN